MVVLTDADRNSIKYFIEDKGDITRWTEWEEKKDAIFRGYPALRSALFNLEVAELTLKTVVAGIANGELG